MFWRSLYWRAAGKVIFKVYLEEFRHPTKRIILQPPSSPKKLTPFNFEYYKNTLILLVPIPKRKNQLKFFSHFFVVSKKVL